MLSSWETLVGGWYAACWNMALVFAIMPLFFRRVGVNVLFLCYCFLVVLKKVSVHKSDRMVDDTVIT